MLMTLIMLFMGMVGIMVSFLGMVFLIMGLIGLTKKIINWWRIKDVDTLQRGGKA